MTGLVADAGDEADLGSAAAWMGSGMRTARAGGRARGPHGCARCQVDIRAGPQGKIERWHQAMRNRILVENYYLPGALEAEVADFVDQYNHRRHDESLSNLTPADVYLVRGKAILLERLRIKRKTIKQRRVMHHQSAD